MGLRAVLMACVVCLLLSGVSLAAERSNQLTADGQRASPQLLAVTPPPEAPAELSLPDAVQLALDHNSGFRRSVQALLDTRSDLLVAQQRWGLGAFGTAERLETYNSSQAGAEMTYGALTGADLSLRSELNWLTNAGADNALEALVRQPLLAGRGPASTWYETNRAARTAYQSSLLSYYLARQDLMVDVVGAYLGAVQREQVVGIQQDAVRLAQESVRDADLRLKEGLGIEIDLMRAQLWLAQAQSNEIQARQAQQDAVDNLLLLLGVRVEGSPKLVTAVAYEPAAQDVDAAVSYAVEHRPELQIADYSVQDYQAALRIARSNRLPALDLLGGLRGGALGLAEQAWNVGLQATVPIGSRERTETARRSEWALLVAQQDQQDLRQRVVAEVRRQARAAEAARANVDIATKSVDVAEASLKIAQRLVEEGLDTNRNVLDAQSDLASARTNLVSSKLDYYLALISLRRAMGMDVAELLLAPAPAAAVQPVSIPAGAAATPPAPPAPAESSPGVKQE